MKRKTMKRSISTLLTLAMLLGLLPGTAFAALPEEAQDVIEFKVMQLENLSSGDFVSLYKYKNGLNTFHAPINMNEGTQGGFSLTRLSFAISMSQPISLEVYEMADDYPIAHRAVLGPVQGVYLWYTGHRQYRSDRPRRRGGA